MRRLSSWGSYILTKCDGVKLCHFTVGHSQHVLYTWSTHTLPLVIQHVLYTRIMPILSYGGFPVRRRQPFIRFRSQTWFIDKMTIHTNYTFFLYLIIFSKIYDVFKDAFDRIFYYLFSHASIHTNSNIPPALKECLSMYLSSNSM